MWILHIAAPCCSPACCFLGCTQGYQGDPGTSSRPPATPSVRGKWGTQLINNKIILHIPYRAYTHYPIRIVLLNCLPICIYITLSHVGSYGSIDRQIFCRAGIIRIYLDRPMTPFEGKRMLIFWVWQWRDPATGRADVREGWLLLWCCTPLLSSSAVSAVMMIVPDNSTLPVFFLSTAHCSSEYKMLQYFITAAEIHFIQIFRGGEDRRNTHCQRSLDAVMFSGHKLHSGPGAAPGTRDTGLRVAGKFRISPQQPAVGHLTRLGAVNTFRESFTLITIKTIRLP